MSGQNYSVISARKVQIVASGRFMGGCPILSGSVLKGGVIPHPPVHLDKTEENPLQDGRVEPHLCKKTQGWGIPHHSIELRSTSTDAEAPCDRQQAKACHRENQKQPEVIGCPWPRIEHVRRRKHGGLGICGIVVDDDWAARPVTSHPLMHPLHPLRVSTPT
jgi:hypothetical protein